MVDSVIDLDVGNFEGVDSLQATNIETVLFWIRAPLMVGVDSTNRAEKVPGYVCIELILSQKLATGHNFQTGKWDRSHNCPFSSANRAITMPGLLDSVRKLQFKNYSAAMAGGAMRVCDRGSSDFLNHLQFAPAT